MARPWCTGLFALVLLTFTSCGGDGPRPTELRLAELVRFADRYDGEVVVTTGIVRMFNQPEHYWIQDEELNRVRIRPQSAVSEFRGEWIRVVGRFEYDPSTGRVIEARDVTLVE